MDRYDRLMNDILEKTAAGALRWTVMARQDYDQALAIPDGVRRIFRADYLLGDQSYRLCFVKSRTKRFGDFGAVHEVSEIEIHVLNQDNRVALVLVDVDGLVERDDLLRLSGLIDANNEQTREFFEAFDRSGAA
jgi:hypothetical protein